MLQKLLGKGGFVLNEENKRKLQNVLWVNGALNGKIVAQSPKFIADAAGFAIPAETQFFIVPETGYGMSASHHFLIIIWFQSSNGLSSV